MYVNYKFTAEKYSKSRIGEKKRKGAAQPKATRAMPKRSGG
jgi:hypothetical protein